MCCKYLFSMSWRELYRLKFLIYSAWMIRLLDYLSKTATYYFRFFYYIRSHVSNTCHMVFHLKASSSNPYTPILFCNFLSFLASPRSHQQTASQWVDYEPFDSVIFCRNGDVELCLLLTLHLWFGARLRNRKHSLFLAPLKSQLFYTFSGAILLRVKLSYLSQYAGRHPYVSR